MNDLTVKFAHVLDQVLDGVEHGFFGRKGGVSKGVYQSLNAGFGSNDSPQDVTENRKRIAAAMGTNPDNLLSNHQIHSTKVVVITKPIQTRQQADAFVTDRPNIALSALSADCAPILFCDKKAGIIGAAHAGWRGALAGITDETIKAMLNLGAKRSQIHAAIGPCISMKNYEVGADFLSQFINDNLGNRKFFQANRHGKYQFDLKAYLLSRLKKQGLRNIQALPDCTYAQNDEFFSYRYNTHKGIADYGRNISVIIRNQ